MLKQATTAAASSPAARCRCNNEAQDAAPLHPPCEQANMQQVKPTSLTCVAPAGSAAVLTQSDIVGLILLRACGSGDDVSEESRDLLLRAKLVCRVWRTSVRLRLEKIAGGFVCQVDVMRTARDVGGIVAGMRFFRGHAKVQTKCCEALLALTPTSEDEEWRPIPEDEDKDEELDIVTYNNVCRDLADQGVIGAVVKAIMVHANLEGVARPAIKILTLLASSEDEDVAEEMQEDIALEGGIEAVLAGLEAHSTSAQVQELGLEAIVTFGGGLDWAHTLALDNEAPYDNGNVLKIVEERGIETVVVGLRAHQGNVNLQKIGFRALKVLSSQSDENHVVKKGGLDAVLVGLQAHRQTPELQELGISLLANFAFSNDNESSVMVIEKGAIDYVISGMEMHRENIAVQHVGLLAMAAISSQCVNAKGERIIDDEAVLEDKQVIKTLLAVSEAHRNDGLLQAHLMEMTKFIIFHGDNSSTEVGHKIQAAFIHKGGVQVVLQALLAHTGNAEVQDKGWYVLGLLSVGDFEPSVAALGGIEAVLAGLSAHRGNADMQTKGLMVLDFLASDHDSTARLVKNQGIEAVVSGLESNQGDAKVQEAGIRLLGRILVHDDFDKNRKLIVTCRGIEAVLTGLSAHRGNADMQTKGLMVLEFLASDHDSTARLVKNQGIEAAVSGLESNQGDAEVQEAGIRLLGRIIVHDDFDKNRELIVMVTEKGVIDYVIAGMEMHRENIKLQQKGIVALAVIFVKSVDAIEERIIDNHVALEHKKVIKALLAVSEAHQNDGKLQAEFLKWLRYIICWNPTTTMGQKIQAAFIDKAGVQVVLEALLAHRDNTEVQGKGLMVLGMLTVHDSNWKTVKKIIATKGGIEVVLTGLSAHQVNAEVQEHGLLVLANLAEDHDSNVTIVENGGIEAGIAGLEAHQGVVEVQTMGIRLLGNILVFGNDKNKELMVDRGSIELVTRGMMLHRGASFLQVFGIMMLEGLIGKTINPPLSRSDQAIQERIRRAGGEACVRAAMVDPGLPTDASAYGIPIAGKRLLDQLARLKTTTFATFEAGLQQCSLLKRLIESIRELVNEADFDVSSTGISLQAMDPNHVSLVSLNLRAEGFQHFHCDRSLSLGINLASITKVLDCAGNDDSVTLKAEDQGHHLTLMFASPNMDRISDFEVKLMDIDSERLSITNTDYKASVKMSAVEFKRIVCDLSRIGDTVTISCTKAGVKFSIEGDIGKGNIFKRHHADVDQEEDMTTIQLEEPVSLTVALRYLNLFTKATPLSPTVTLNMSPCMPLATEYKISGMGHIRFFLAPLIEET